ncbi:hypothetical protein BGZ63DRAFT_237069 [Mariannaea sp. PMI_226]|nr:hypothetical protein BGZ63DRAFT_237069 [Mariannaea sp. PMI_226]
MVVLRHERRGGRSEAFSRRPKIVFCDTWFSPEIVCRRSIFFWLHSIFIHRLALDSISSFWNWWFFLFPFLPQRTHRVISDRNCMKYNLGIHFCMHIPQLLACFGDVVFSFSFFFFLQSRPGVQYLHGETVPICAVICRL